MDMSDSVNVLFQNFHRVDSCKRTVSAVKQQVNKLRINFCHKTVDLFFRLYDSSHMMVESQSHSLVFCNFPEFIQSFCEKLPLLIVHHIFSFKDRLVLSLRTVTLLGHTDDFRPHSFQEIGLFNKLFFCLFIWL